MGRGWLERAFFLASFAFLAFLIGHVSARRNWPPSAIIARATTQARQVLTPGSEPPHYLVPTVYDWSGTRSPGVPADSSSLTLISTLWPDIGWGVKLIDREGNEVHHWRTDPRDLFPDHPRARGGTVPTSWMFPHGTHLFPDGDLLVNIEYVGTVRMDACGEVRWRVAEGNHHSIHPAEDGSFWIPTGAYDPDDADGLHPLPEVVDGVARDQVSRISADGRVLETIDVAEILFENDLEYLIPKLYHDTGGDFMHVNDAEPLPSGMAAQYPLFDAGDLVISMRHVDLVMVIDPESKELLWHDSNRFIRQHDPDFVGDGWIGVFDNRTDLTPRGDLLGGSRIVMVQPHTDSVRVVFPTDASEPFYTHAAGKWQLLPSGNMLLTEARAARVVEVDPEGRTVWEWVNEPVDDGLVPEVMEGTRVPVTRSDVAGWSCAGDDPE